MESCTSTCVREPIYHDLESDPLSLFNSIADGAWEETVTCENGNRPQDWTFVSSGYTITYDEATAE